MDPAGGTSFWIGTCTARHLSASAASEILESLARSDMGLDQRARRAFDG